MTEPARPGLDLPPTAALADVLQLAGRPGHLTPPLVWRTAPPAPTLVPVRTVQLVVADDGPGIGAFRDLFDDDLAGRAVVVAGGAAIGGAVFGELLAMAATAAGAAAVLLDAGVRDLDAVAATGLPVAATHRLVAGPGGRGHVAGVDVAVEIGVAPVGVDTHVLLDGDGIVAVDPALGVERCLDWARRYAAAEEIVAAALRDGSSLADAYGPKAEAVAAIRAELPSD